MGINIYQNGGSNPSLDLVDDATSKTIATFKARANVYSDLASKVTHFDDFIGKTILGTWDVNKGSDGSAANFAINTAISGTVRATTGAGAGVSYAANGVQLSSALNFKAGQGNLVFETKVKISAITSVAIYVGLTDQVSSLEMPMTLGGSDALTTNATDGVGFLFDTAADTDTIWLAGVANDVDATKVNTGLAYVADTYRTFRIELDTSGNATFYIDGVKVGTMTTAVTASVALTPVVAGFSRTTSTRTIDVDYVFVQQDR